MLKDITHYNGEFKYPVVKIDAGRERTDHEPAPAVLKHRSIIPARAGESFTSSARALVVVIAALHRADTNAAHSALVIAIRYPIETLIIGRCVFAVSRPAPPLATLINCGGYLGASKKHRGLINDLLYVCTTPLSWSSSLSLWKSYDRTTGTEPHLRRLICEQVSDFSLHIAGNLVEGSGLWFSTRGDSRYQPRCNHYAPAIMTSGKLRIHGIYDNAIYSSER